MAFFEDPMQAMAARFRIFLLQIEQFFEKRQGHLVLGVIGRSPPMFFQAGKAILFKGIEDVVDMLLQALGSLYLNPP